MKKTFMILISFVLVLGLSSFSHSHKKVKERTNQPGPSADITYVVSVYAPAGMQSCGTYYVTVRDEFGFPIGAQIQYQAGITDYVFREQGPVQGTRTAVLTENLSAVSACNQVLYTQPASMKSNFRNGSSYLFELYPSYQSTEQ
jgi:hypothetical protein